MHKYIALVFLLALSACSSTDTQPTPPVATPPVTTTTSPSDTETPTGDTAEMPKNAVVSLNYTLREGSPTGTILETTVAEVAQANGLFRSGATYSPFEVVLGTNSVIPGFENGIASMKKGEKKVIEVAPKDGYGEGTIVQTVKEAEVAPEFTITTDISRFRDTVVETVDRAMLGEEGADLVVGKTLTGGAGMVATVTAIDGEKVELSIDNKENPFYGKKLAPGLSAKKGNVNFTIKSLSDTDITLDIVNGDSPFSGKKFEVGATASLPQNPGQTGGEIKVLSISGDTVELSLPNPHPLAGKTLFFEVEMLDIK